MWKYIFSIKDYNSCVNSTLNYFIPFDINIKKILFHFFNSLLVNRNAIAVWILILYPVMLPPHLSVLVLLLVSFIEIFYIPDKQRLFYFLSSTSIPDISFSCPNSLARNFNRKLNEWSFHFSSVSFCFMYFGNLF